MKQKDWLVRGLALGSGQDIPAEKSDWGRRAGSSLFSRALEPPRFDTLWPPSPAPKVPDDHVPPNLCLEVLSSSLLGWGQQEDDSVTHVHPSHPPHGNFSSSKPLYLISSLFSWVSTLIACVGDGYYGLSPFPLQRNLLPTLLPLPDFCFILFPWDEAWLTVSAAPASCHPGDADLCQPGSRREEEEDDCRRREVEMSALTSVKTGRRNHKNRPRIISASGQRLEGPWWRQERISNRVKCLSSLFSSLLHKPVPTDTEPPSRLCCSKSGRCWLSKRRMYWLVIPMLHLQLLGLSDGNQNKLPPTKALWRRLWSHSPGLSVRVVGEEHLAASLFHGAEVWP